MVSAKHHPRNPRSSLEAALVYSQKFDYPLTLEESWFWQPFTRFPRQLFRSWPYHSEGYFFLPGSKKLVSIRKYRKHISRDKLQLSRNFISILSKIPTIEAIYITGSLAMNNCKKNDDIDIMVISSPDSVWITRFLVVAILTLFSKRRPHGRPEHSSRQVSDKICDNLYLSCQKLAIPIHPASHSRNIYLSHEILQARLIWQKTNIEEKFLSANRWTRKYLPVAFGYRWGKVLACTGQRSIHSGRNYLIFVLNSLLFIGQYLYMRSGLTTEKIGLDKAYFHPQSVSVSKNG